MTFLMVINRQKHTRGLLIMLNKKMINDFNNLNDLDNSNNSNNSNNLNDFNNFKN